MNISNKLDRELKARYTEVVEVFSALDIPCLVIGASARELFFEYAYGVPGMRKTQDLDFAIQVSDWKAFAKARQALLDTGFNETRNSHRLCKGDIYPIDIVPFGDIAQDGVIAWPPDGSIRMNVRAFEDALQHAARLMINGSPRTEIAVATPAGMVLMKLICWLSCERHTRTKDAQDIRYAMMMNERFPYLADALYQVDLLEKYDGNSQLIGAELLGREVSKVGSVDSKKLILAAFSEPLSQDQLIAEMVERCISQTEDVLLLWRAFWSGFVAD